jgi:hypothetical protein
MLLLTPQTVSFKCNSIYKDIHILFICTCALFQVFLIYNKIQSTINKSIIFFDSYLNLYHCSNFCKRLSHDNSQFHQILHVFFITNISVLVAIIILTLPTACKITESVKA